MGTILKWWYSYWLFRALQKHLHNPVTPLMSSRHRAHQHEPTLPDPYSIRYTYNLGNISNVGLRHSLRQDLNIGKMQSGICHYTLPCVELYTDITDITYCCQSTRVLVQMQKKTVFLLKFAANFLLF